MWVGGVPTTAAQRRVKRREDMHMLASFDALSAVELVWALAARVMHSFASFKNGSVGGGGPLASDGARSAT